MNIEGSPTVRCFSLAAVVPGRNTSRLLRMRTLNWRYSRVSKLRLAQFSTMLWLFARSSFCMWKFCWKRVSLVRQTMKEIHVGSDVAAIESSVKNKWRWAWLTEDEDSDIFGTWCKKTDQPGACLCMVCHKSLTYGTSGKRALVVCVCVPPLPSPPARLPPTPLPPPPARLPPSSTSFSKTAPLFHLLQQDCPPLPPPPARLPPTSTSSSKTAPSSTSSSKTAPSSTSSCKTSPTPTPTVTLRLTCQKACWR